MLHHTALNRAHHPCTPPCSTQSFPPTSGRHAASPSRTRPTRVRARTLDMGGAHPRAFGHAGGACSPKSGFNKHRRQGQQAIVATLRRHFTPVCPRTPQCVTGTGPATNDEHDVWAGANFQVGRQCAWHSFLVPNLAVRRARPHNRGCEGCGPLAAAAHACSPPVAVPCQERHVPCTVHGPPECVAASRSVPLTNLPLRWRWHGPTAGLVQGRGAARAARQHGGPGRRRRGGGQCGRPRELCHRRVRAHEAGGHRRCFSAPLGPGRGPRRLLWLRPSKGTATQGPPPATRAPARARRGRPVPAPPRVRRGGAACMGADAWHAACVCHRSGSAPRRRGAPSGSPWSRRRPKRAPTS